MIDADDRCHSVKRHVIAEFLVAIPYIRLCNNSRGYGMLSHRRDGVVDAHSAIFRIIDKASVDVAAAVNSGGNSRFLSAPISIHEGNVVGRRAVLVANELHVFIGGENKRRRVV